MGLTTNRQSLSASLADILRKRPHGPNRAAISMEVFTEKKDTFRESLEPFAFHLNPVKGSLFLFLPQNAW